MCCLDVISHIHKWGVSKWSTCNVCMYDLVKFYLFVLLLLFFYSSTISLFVYGVVLYSKTSLALCTLGDCMCYCCRLLTFFQNCLFQGVQGLDPNCLQYQQTIKVTASTEIKCKIRRS